MDSGYFDYSFALSYETNINKEFLISAIKELSDDYSFVDKNEGKLFFLVCFKTSEKYNKFLETTNINNYQTLSDSNAIKDKFFYILDLHKRD